MQTNFTVSNTDVITMLVVKQREQLELKREQLRLEWISIKDSMEKKAIESYNKQLKKLNPILHYQCKNLFKAGFLIRKFLFKSLDSVVLIHLLLYGIKVQNRTYTYKFQSRNKLLKTDRIVYEKLIMKMNN